MVGNALLGEPHNCLKLNLPNFEPRATDHFSMVFEAGCGSPASPRRLVAAEAPSASAPARKRFAGPEIAR
jgi:hypothetical protein